MRGTWMGAAAAVSAVWLVACAGDPSALESDASGESVVDTSMGGDASMVADGTQTASGDAEVGGNDADRTGAAPQAAPTWHQDVAPLLNRSCVICHQEGGLAYFSLTRYAEAAPRAALLATTVAAKIMPPWGLESTDDCVPRLGFKEDLRLSEAEIAMLSAWADAGAPEGDAATAVALPEADTIEISRLDLALKPAAGYVAEGKVDEFICFPLDPKFMTDVFVQAVFVVPENGLVAHHALVFTDPKGQGAALGGDKGWYPCFGDAHVDDSMLLAAWAPGGRPMELPANAGMPLAAGTQLVLQMHYHPVGEAAAPDATAVQLKFTTEEPEWHSLVALLGNFNQQNGEGYGLQADADGEVAFTIPAGAGEHTETMAFENKADLFGKPMPEHYLYAVAPHMHYLGKSMVATIERHDPATPMCPVAMIGPLLQCLLNDCADAADTGACAQEQCKAEGEALDDLCQSCLAGQIGGLGDAQAAVGACMSGVEYTSAAQPAQECLFASPHYLFEWQRLYNYAGLIEDLPIVRPGDVIRFSCTYDNTLANPYVAEALSYQGLDAPVDVYLGDTTLDEMCLLVLQTLYKPYATPPSE